MARGSDRSLHIWDLEPNAEATRSIEEEAESRKCKISTRQQLIEGFESMGCYLNYESRIELLMHVIHLSYSSSK